jgi:threonyl-tRNA synthetase
MIGFLIEHYAGNFPVWLSPEQVRVIPITDAQNDYAAQIAAQLRGEGNPRQCGHERRAHECQDPSGAIDEGAVHAGGRRQ